MRASSSFRRLALLTVLCAICSWIAACGGKQVAGGCGVGFTVRFAIGSVKDGLPLDSLDVDIAVGGGSPQRFAVNLKTGVSSASIKAAQGQSYALRFELFSAGHKIGKGESQGRLDCDLNVALNPVWNEDSTKQAKLDLGSGLLLPARLSLFYTQALAGSVFSLPLDSLPGLRYRWYVKLNDSNLIEDEGFPVRFPIADSLAGKSLTLRLQVLSGNAIKEERIWVIAVLANAPKDHVARMIVRADTASKDGISSVFRYSGDRLIAVEEYDAAVPLGGAVPAGVESLYYDDKGRLSGTHSSRPDGSALDSSFAYAMDGRLAYVEQKDTLGIVRDSLFFEGGKLYNSRRYVDGKPTETVKFRWSGSDLRVDSIFREGSGGPALARRVTNLFRGDSLLERQVALMRSGPSGNALAAYTKEAITYNGLGSRAWREFWLEGQTASLERTDAYGYDAKGRLVSILSQDVRTGLPLQAIGFEYSPSSASPKASAAQAGVRETAASLAELRYVHSDWERRLSARVPGNPGE